MDLPALGYQPPKSPLDSLGKVLGLRAAQEQITGAEQDNQLRALQLKDQQILRTSAQGIDWQQSDAFDKFLTNAQPQGLSPQTLSQMAQQRQQFLKSVAETDDATLKTQATRNNQLLGHLDAIRAETDPAKRSQVAQTQAAQILSDGTASHQPQQVQQMVQAVAQGKIVPNDDDLNVLSGGLLDHNTQIENKLKSTQTAESQAKTREANASAGAKEAQTQAFQGTGLVPGLSPDEQGLINYMRSVPGAKPENYSSWKAN